MSVSFLEVNAYFIRMVESIKLINYSNVIHKIFNIYSLRQTDNLVNYNRSEYYVIDFL